MLAHQVVPRWMCLVAGQMKKFLQKVTFVKSSKLLFQLLWLIGCHKYSIWNWFSLLLGPWKESDVWCNGQNVCLMKSIYMLWFSFILGLNLNFFCFEVIIIYYHSPKQKEIKFKPRIELNHNIYNIYFYLNKFESLPQELDCSSMGLYRSIILMWLLSFLPHCDYIFPSPSPPLGERGAWCFGCSFI